MNKSDRDGSGYEFSALEAALIYPQHQGTAPLRMSKNLVTKYLGLCHKQKSCIPCFDSIRGLYSILIHQLVNIAFNSTYIRLGFLCKYNSIPYKMKGLWYIEKRFFPSFLVYQKTMRKCLYLSLLLLLIAAAAEGIAIKTDTNELATVKKLMVEDCRAVRGFLGTPVDGSVRSWDYRGTVREYPKTASDGVAYSFNGNDGLHITLANGNGFNAVVLRGGAHTRMYAGVDSLTEPTDQEPLWEFKGGRDVETAQFSRPVSAKKVSFFGTQDGLISDVSFYRIETEGYTDSQFENWNPVDAPPPIEKPDSEFAPESVYKAMRELYSEQDNQIFTIAEGDSSGPSPKITGGQAVHFITPPFSEEKGLMELELNVNARAESGPVPFTVAIQDPLDPRLDLVWLEMEAQNPGRFQLRFDVPNQVLLKGSQVWVTMRFGRDLTLQGAPLIRLRLGTKAEALPEAISHRKLLMRSFFSLLSEPRPWGAYRRMTREEFYNSSQYAKQCPELFMTIDRCYEMDPADDLVRQYGEWVYARNLEELSDVSPPLDPPEGVPEWAWYPRSAWLEVRRIAQWNWQRPIKLT